jgi:hypothetical protein
MRPLGLKNSLIEKLPCCRSRAGLWQFANRLSVKLKLKSKIYENQNMSKTTTAIHKSVFISYVTISNSTVKSPFPFVDDAKVNTILYGYVVLKKAFSNILYLSLKFSIFLRYSP